MVFLTKDRYAATCIPGTPVLLKKRSSLWNLAADCFLYQ